jgi:hypothetical protein
MLQPKDEEFKLGHHPTPFKNTRKNSKTPALTGAKKNVAKNLTSLKHLLDPPQRLPCPLLILDQRKPHVTISIVAKTNPR